MFCPMSKYGTIWAENNFNKNHLEIGTAENENRNGAVFCFSLPLAEFRSDD
jgi:hypothetical protein